jgi:glucokinase
MAHNQPIPLERLEDHSTSSLAIGVDVGATKIASALVAADGRVLAQCQQPTAAQNGPAPVLDRIANQIEDLVSAASSSHERSIPAPHLLGVGIGTPGQVNPQTGVVRNAVNLGWERVELVAEIRRRMSSDLPVWLQKDANASALGEYYFGAARNYQDFVYLGIGSGLGAGVLSGGRLVTGSNWNAAELGHLSLDPQGLPCNCGLRGCAETVISGPGLLAVVQRRLSLADQETNLVSGNIDPHNVVAAARAGDELALASLAEVGSYLGRIMAACTAVLNPALFVLGGGLGLAAYEWLAPAALEELKRRVLATSYQSVRIAPSKLESSAVGAAGLVWYYKERGMSFESKGGDAEDHSIQSSL